MATQEGDLRGHEAAAFETSPIRFAPPTTVEELFGVDDSRGVMDLMLSSSPLHIGRVRGDKDGQEEFLTLFQHPLTPGDYGNFYFFLGGPVDPDNRFTLDHKG